MSTNVTWYNGKIGKIKRGELKNHKPACLWFTGLSGSGKSTIAAEVEAELFKRKCHTYMLDGDNIRHGLNKDLGFNNEDRTENIRRIGEVAKLFVDAGIIVLTAFISPFRKDRSFARDLFENDEFVEIFVDCDLEICEERDPKGLYKKARNNEIIEFTGISSEYENPVAPEIIMENDNRSDIQKNVKKVIDYLVDNKIIED